MLLQMLNADKVLMERGKNGNNAVNKITMVQERNKTAGEGLTAEMLIAEIRISENADR
jgi:hypothetical protein